MAAVAGGGTRAGLPVSMVLREGEMANGSTSGGSSGTAAQPPIRGLTGFGKELIRVLEKWHKDMPPWAKITGYLTVLGCFVAVVAMIGLTVYAWAFGGVQNTAQDSGYYLFRGRAMFAPDENGKTDYAGDRLLLVKESNIEVIVDQNGNVAVPFDKKSFHDLYDGADKKLIVQVRESREHEFDIAEAELKKDANGYHIAVTVSRPAAEEDLIGALETDPPTGVGPRPFRLVSSARAAEPVPAGTVLKIDSIDMPGAAGKSPWDNTVALEIRNKAGIPVMGAINPTVNVTSGVAAIRGQMTDVRGGVYIDLEKARPPKPDGAVELEIFDTNKGKKVDDLTIPPAQLGQPTFEATDANNGIKFVFQPRQPYEAIVFEKADSAVRAAAIEGAMGRAGIWYRPVKSVLSRNTETNALFFGKDVPLTVAKGVLKELVDAWPELDLRRIAFNVPLRSGRYNTMQLGASKAAKKCQTIDKATMEQLFAAASFDDWTNMLSSCQANK